MRAAMIGSTLRRGLDSVRHVAQPRGTLLARDTASGNYEMCETLVSEREHSPDLGWLRSLARVGTVLARWFAALAPARCRWMKHLAVSCPVWSEIGCQVGRPDCTTRTACPAPGMDMPARYGPLSMVSLDGPRIPTRCRRSACIVWAWR